MSPLEKMLRRHGATLIKQGRHRVYEWRGRRFTLHSGTIGCDRSPQKSDMRWIRETADEMRRNK